MRGEAGESGALDLCGRGFVCFPLVPGKVINWRSAYLTTGDFSSLPAPPAISGTRGWLPNVALNGVRIDYSSMEASR